MTTPTHRAERPERHRRVTRGRLVDAALCVIPLLALVVWRAALGGVNLDGITDLGLVSVLPPAVFGALGAVVVSFVTALCVTRSSSAVLVTCVLAFIVMIHGTTPVLYDLPRYSWTYKHIGVTDFIAQIGAVDRSIDVYHNWPGLFAAAALFSKLVGVTSALSYAGWAQVLFNVLLLPILHTLFRRLSGDRVVTWLAIWFFYTSNWIGQDYFAPQAVGFLLHLGVMLIVLTRLSPVTAAQPASAAPSRRALVGVAALGLYAAIVASHQLTPVMTLTAVTALLVVRRLTWPVLPFLMGALLAAWLIFVARDYLLAHPFWQSSFGGARDNVGKQLADLTVVSPERAFVASVARTHSALVWLLALIGAAWHLRTRRLNLAVAAVWAAPFPLLVVNSYGGELLFRIFLFTLPWSALLIAYAVTALPNQTRGARTVRTLTVATLSVVLTAALTLTYFGQERMNYVRQGDLSSSLFVNDAAPPEAAVMTLTSNFPLNVRSSHLNYYELSWVYSAEPGRTPADAVRDIVTFMRSREEPASYFIVSRGQLEQAALLGTMPREFAEQIKMLAARHPKLRVVFQDGDAVVFELVREEPREAR